jgi:hypothetical protein
MRVEFHNRQTWVVCVHMHVYTLHLLVACVHVVCVHVYTLHLLVHLWFHIRYAYLCVFRLISVTLGLFVCTFVSVIYICILL